MRATVIINGSVNAKIVGQSAYKIAQIAGVEVPKSTKILIGEATSVEPSEAMAHEKLSPVLGMYKAKTFDEALAKAERLVADGGYGHTSSLYVNVNEKEKIQKHYEAMKTCRVLINTPSSQGGIGDLYNFKMAPSLTLGCGSWGGNSVSENVGPKHLLNVKTVAERRENMLWFRAPEKVYFWDVAPDPTLQCAREGAKILDSFQPDVIIAFGGGSAMDAGKIMWVLYEHPEANFEDMAMDFMDIRKRVYTYPEMGSKAYFVAIPTSSGTGSECTPFSVITDAETGIKWPLADYALLPNMAIVDANNMDS